MADKAEREQIALYVCKVCPCPNRQKHSWEECIYAHPKENARRRDVRKHRYIAEPCPDYANKEFCDLGDDCPFAHGTFEINLHPSKYCTKVCTKYPHCDRKICFFAHGEDQLRQPDLSYGYTSVAEAECVRQNLQAIRNGAPSVHQVSSSPFPAPQLKRISPLQIPPSLRSPPQQSRASSIADGFRTSLPQHSQDLYSPYANLSPSVLDMHNVRGDRGYLSPGMMDMAAFSKRLASPDVRLSLDENALSERQSLQSIASSLEAASTALMSPNSSLSVESSGPRMSMKKARELGLQPPSKSRCGSLPESVQSMKSTLRSPPTSRQASRASPQSSKSLWKSNPTMVISPQGRLMPLEEAINLVSYLSAPEKVANGKASNLANMATAITALYGMGYTLAEDESSHSEVTDEDRGSDKSSPDIHCHRQLAGTFDPAHQLFSPATSLLQAPVPAGSQYAAMLAGIGLNLTAGRSQEYSLFS